MMDFSSGWSTLISVTRKGLAAGATHRATSGAAEASWNNCLAVLTAQRLLEADHRLIYHTNTHEMPSAEGMFVSSLNP